jgi:alkaline phosphatase
MQTIGRYKRIAPLLLALLLIAGLGCAPKSEPESAPSVEPVVIATNEPEATAAITPLPQPQLKYIFLFIGDGMGYAQIQAASEALAAAGREPLSFVDFPVQGSQKTASFDGSVTDSAAGATAMSTGKKTVNGYLGLDSDKNRIETIAETLRNAGRKIGILTTVSLDHATPAGFYAHVDSRRSYAMITDDLFASGFDYFAGGGFHSTPDAADRALENGYTLIHSFEEAPVSTDGNLILSSNLIFGDYGVLPAIDGGARADWLKKATDLAITRLTAPEGFFMMVEGGRVDYFCHYNDAGSFVAELLDMDEAVQSALAFYAEHPQETLILVTADHETGNVSFTDGDRAALLKQTISSDICDNSLVEQCLAAKMPFEEALPLFASAFGLSDLTAAETASLQEAYGKTFYANASGNSSEEESGVYTSITTACIDIVAARAGVIFGSGGHTGKDVPVFAIGIGSEFFAGSNENTNIHDALLKAVAAYPFF